MTDLRLVLEPESLEVGPRGTVTGRIFFSSNSEGFPDSAWNDFVLVVLRWWSEALAALHHGSSNEAELVFMDGPFAVRLRRHSDEDYTAEFIERSRNRVVGRATVQLADLLRDVADAAKIALGFSEHGAAATADVEALRSALSRIVPS